MDGKYRSAATLLALVVLAGCAPREPNESAGSQALDVAQTLRGSHRTGFERAIEPRTFLFPRDHGPHPRFQTEWWYLTGHLSGGGDAPLGYQATFFRSALDPEPAERSSAWATGQIYLAHFAVTDPAGNRFHAFERFGRGAVGIAGARAEPLRVWLEDWELSELPGASEYLPRLRLRLAEAEVAVDLNLVALKPAVLHGDRGLSRKGSQPGNASYYYSFTRLATTGTVRIGKRELAVDGLSWMDREWSTSVLEEDQVGWDWVSLHLPGERELMVFQLRRADGGIDRVSGTWVDAAGDYSPLPPADARLTALDTWTSPKTGITYPSRWRLALESRGLELEFAPTLPQQEHAGAFTYWEGAVAGSFPAGEAPGTPFRGYVELTGYGARPKLR